MNTFLPRSNDRQIMQKHFCVGCFVYDRKEKKFLLVYHKKLKKWLQPGGHIEPDEDPEEAVLREVFEETGLRINLFGKRYPRETDFILPLAVQKDIIEPGHQHIVFIYAGEPTAGSRQIKVNSIEVNDVKWFTLEEISQNDFNTFNDVTTWCRYIYSNYYPDT